MSLPTTCSGGGPVILLPIELVAEWRGTEPPVGATVPDGWQWGSGGIECDYDRACSSKSLLDHDTTPYGGVGWLRVGAGAALIFDCELSTSWLADAAGGFVIRNGGRNLTEQDARLIVKQTEGAAWRELTVDFKLAGGAVAMFDSAFAGEADPEAIATSDGVAIGQIAPGSYRVAVATTVDEVDVIRLQRAE